MEFTGPRSCPRVALLGLLGSLLALGASPAPAAGDGESTPPPRLRWLTELGAESHAARAQPSPAGEIVWASVPGAALAFRVGADGSLEKLRRVPTDFASGTGLVTAGAAAVVADRDGRIAFYAPSPRAAADAPRWQREPGEPVLSLAWDGGERIFAATRDERMLALRAGDGAKLWSAPLGGRASAPALAAAGGLFVAAKPESLVRLDAASGKQLWSAALDGPAVHAPALASPAAPGAPALVLCGSWRGTLFAFDADSGRELWSVPLGSRLAAGPAVVGELVVVATEDGSARAFTLRGEPAWQAPGAVDGAAVLLAAGASPTPGGVEPGRRVIALSRKLGALAAATGERLDAYPDQALEELRRRFQRAMMEGEGAASAAEQRAAQEREAFAISGLLFGAPAAQPGGLVLGTEEGWVYRFDAQTLRPSFRYRAGIAAESTHAPAEGHLLVSAGEELFALSPASGEVVWRRGVGGAVQQIAGERWLAVLTRDRLTELDALDGTRRWTQPTPAAFVSDVPAAPEAGVEEESGSWWVDDGAGGLQLVASRGAARRGPDVAGSPLRPVPIAGSRSWLGATREGRVYRFEPPASGAADAAFEIAWEQVLPEAISDVRSAGDAVLVRLASGTLLALATAFGEEQWRVAVDPAADYRIEEGERMLLIYGAQSLQLRDLRGGSARLVRQLGSPALAAQLRGPALYWVDRSGGAHVADADHGALLGSSDLGVRLKQARAVPDGFVVLTDAGEVGFVELPSAAAGAASDLE